MYKGISLHIGINKLSTLGYSAEAPLSSPENDAKAMAYIAQTEGYQSSQLLLNEEATKKNFLTCFEKCITTLNAGDTFLLSFSGHGGQITDENGDEEDGKDETWCFYDAPLIDDEIGSKWQEFKKGVRIIVVSASCHSRTALKAYTADCFSGNDLSPIEIYQKSIEQNNASFLYSYTNDEAIQASILHLSACEDAQEARDGSQLTRFTRLLLQYWDLGRFTGNYTELVQKISSESGYLQKAGIAQLGNKDADLLNARPFKLLTPKS